MPTSANAKQAGQAVWDGSPRRWALCTSNNTQIYEGTNQIQRMVMARNLLRG